MKPSYRRSTILVNILHKQIEMIEKAVDKLHEDIQHDYKEEIEELKSTI